MTEKSKKEVAKELQSSTVEVSTEQCEKGEINVEVNLKEIKPEDKRSKVIKELFTSEEVYVNNLNDIVEGYLNPLKENKILSPQIITGIFSNIEIILRFHKEFLESLQQKIVKWFPNQQIGDIFLYLAPYLKLYSQYCSNYDHSISLIQQHKKTNVQFNQFLIDSQTSARFKGSYITSYLILPIQRIPRYELFLKELLKKTPAEHPDAANIEKSLDLVAKLAVSVNGACEKAENIQKIIEISKSINMEKLLKPTRIFIREDELELYLELAYVVSKVFVFNDLIVFSVKKSKIMPKNYISYSLGLCWIQELTEISTQVITPTITLLLKFPDEKMKESWESTLVKTINDLINNVPEYKETRMGYDLMEQSGIYTAVSKNAPQAIDPSGANAPKKKKRKSRILDLKDKLLGDNDKKVEIETSLEDVNAPIPDLTKLTQSPRRSKPPVISYNSQLNLREHSKKYPFSSSKALRRSTSINQSGKKSSRYSDHLKFFDDDDDDESDDDEQNTPPSFSSPSNNHRLSLSFNHSTNPLTVSHSLPFVNPPLSANSKSKNNQPVNFIAGLSKSGGFAGKYTKPTDYKYAFPESDKHWRIRSTDTPLGECHSPPTSPRADNDKSSHSNERISSRSKSFELKLPKELLRTPRSRNNNNNNNNNDQKDSARGGDKTASDQKSEQPKQDFFDQLIKSPRRIDSPETKVSKNTYPDPKTPSLSSSSSNSLNVGSESSRKKSKLRKYQTLNLSKLTRSSLIHSDENVDHTPLSPTSPKKDDKHRPSINGHSAFDLFSRPVSKKKSVS